MAEQLPLVRMATDCETTGLKAGYHEILQLAFIAFDNDLNPTGHEFKSYVIPTRPYAFSKKAQEVNKIDLKDINPVLTPNLVRASFMEWFNNTFPDHKISALGHGYTFDKRFYELFFTEDIYEKLFHYRFEDSQISARLLKSAGLLDVKSVGLQSLCNYLGVERKKEHDAYEDALATLKVYKKLLGILKGLKAKA